MSDETASVQGPFCHQCGADTQGDPVSYVPAPKQGGPFYYCGVCRPPVQFASDPTVPAPSDEALKAATAAVKANREYAVSIPGEKYLFVAPEEQAYDTVVAAYAIDWPRREAEVRAEADALLAHARELLAMKDNQIAEARAEERAATLQEVIEWLTGRSGYAGGCFTSAEDVRDAIAAHFNLEAE